VEQKSDVKMATVPSVEEKSMKENEPENQETKESNKYTANLVAEIIDIRKNKSPVRKSPITSKKQKTKMDVTVAQFASEVNDVSGFLKPGKKRSLNQITSPAIKTPVRINQRLKKEPQI
jgi:cytochrome c1